MTGRSLSEIDRLSLLILLPATSQLVNTDTYMDSNLLVMYCKML